MGGGRQVANGNHFLMKKVSDAGQMETKERHFDVSTPAAANEDAASRRPGVVFAAWKIRKRRPAAVAAAAAAKVGDDDSASTGSMLFHQLQTHPWHQFTEFSPTFIALVLGKTKLGST